MQPLVSQNTQLKQMAQKYHDQIQQLRQKSSQHENEIQTLLKFNQKLLGIIEKQLTSRNIKSSDIMSLQPISQRTQESNIFESQFTNPMISSQFGSPNIKSAIFQQSQNPTPMANYQKEEQLSIVVSHEGQIKSNVDNEQNQLSSLIQAYHKEFKPSNQRFPKTMNEIQNHVKNQIKSFKTFKEESTKFYDSSLEKLSHMKQKYCALSPRKELSRMIDELDADKMIKQQLKSYLNRR